MLEPFSNEELAFIQAVEKYKAEHCKAFLSWSEVLQIVKRLGYTKISNPTAKGEDLTPIPTKTVKQKKKRKTKPKQP